MRMWNGVILYFYMEFFCIEICYDLNVLKCFFFVFGEFDFFVMYWFVFVKYDCKVFYLFYQLKFEEICKIKLMQSSGYKFLKI